MAMDGDPSQSIYFNDLGWMYESFKRYQRFKGDVLKGEVHNGYVCGGTRQQETNHVPVSCQQAHILQIQSINYVMLF